LGVRRMSAELGSDLSRVRNKFVCTSQVLEHHPNKR
jgi:hypothetical protein